MHDAPVNPVGELVLPPARDMNAVREQTAVLASTPSMVRAVLNGLTPVQLETKYKNWTVRQIIHHLTDSNLNIYTRWKLALTEPTPRIAPYNETMWSEMIDARTADLALSLSILDGLHARWDMVMRAMKPEEFDRDFFHPQRDSTLTLWQAAAMYSWHARHHCGQIKWLRDHYRW
ncbi:MAG: putative metal-dependent hydrolase [Phycisphaerae bacterium]|nr:putative metal-dependent hydrolase [Phycisphaerae bacterium]